MTIDVTEQMFVTLGLALMQVSIMDGDEELVTFAQPVMVEPNLKAGDFPESSTDVTFLDDAIKQANEAVETATTAAQQAATAVQKANTAISNANSAIADVNEAVASMNANFANLAQVATINALQTTAKTVVGAINELNSKILFGIDKRYIKVVSGNENSNWGGIFLATKINMLLISINGTSNPEIVWSAIDNSRTTVNSGESNPLETIIDTGSANSHILAIPIGAISKSEITITN